jgi:SAM-dependent methyltransferase
VKEQSMNKSHAIQNCMCCGASAMRSFFEARQVPVHSCIMLATEEEAREFPRGDVELALCERCGFIGNIAYDPAHQAYSPKYEDQQSFSPTFNAFAKELASRLIDKYDLHGKRIVEIGCGKGDFLVLLCELGNNTGVGIDPTSVEERMKKRAAGRVTFIQDYYSERYGEQVGDMILCRHTLEHIHRTAEFMRTIRRSIGKRLDTVVVFEVPDVVRVLEEQAFWDIYYEHCSYFSLGSLGRLFRSSGFEIVDLYADYDDQYLLIEARPAAEPATSPHEREESAGEVSRRVEVFASHFPDRRQQWREFFMEAHAAGRRVAIWGSGSKCVAFLTTLGVRNEVGCVVDINPYRHGKFIPGAARGVESPDFLRKYRPDTVLVMNNIYKKEIHEMLMQMDLNPRLIAVSE